MRTSKKSFSRCQTGSPSSRCVATSSVSVTLMAAVEGLPVGGMAWCVLARMLQAAQEVACRFYVFVEGV